MSEIHLKNGSEMPKKVDEKLRLYSCKYCPYAQRVRLILLAKNVPHHIINIDIFDKPDWFLELNPSGKVPLLDTGNQIIPESIDICNYLNDTYSEPPLYTKEQAHDQELIKELDNLITIFYNLIKTQNESYEYHLEQLLPHVEKYEKELTKRETQYFGGDVPSMLDYMIYPFAERASICGKIYGKKIPNANVFPHLYSWCAAMCTQDLVEKVKIDLQRQLDIYLQVRNNDFNIDFDQ
ncbi:hypothetical protein FQA39_LY17575 [Lamprigera yunnana]|nr:hypothetical protein FQA39_LY17575 [Lamprigera yunnana]